MTGSVFSELIFLLRAFLGESSGEALVHFFFNQVVFLLLSFKSALYILENSPSVVFLRHFLPLCGLSSHSLDRVSRKADVFHFN